VRSAAAARSGKKRKKHERTTGERQELRSQASARCSGKGEAGPRYLESFVRLAERLKLQARFSFVYETGRLEHAKGCGYKKWTIVIIMSFPSAR
jgi:hypothetical protein